MLLVYIFLGLAVGSFITALVPRIEEGKLRSILTDRSRCPKCNKVIAWYDNIPLLSFFLLGGKCRRCGQKISYFYPIVEAISLLVFLLEYFALAHCVNYDSVICSYSQIVGNPFIFLLFFALIYILFTSIFIIDTKHQIIPDELSLMGFALVCFVLLFARFEYFYVNIFVGFASAIFFLLVNLFTKGKGMGLGDAKLSLFAGTLIGLPNIIVYFYSSFIIGAVYGVCAIVLGKTKFGRRIAFGPFLVLGTLIAFLVPYSWTTIIFPFL